MENNVNKQSGNGTVYTEKDLDDYIERLKQQKIGNDLTILKEAVRRRPEAVLNIFSSYDITDRRGMIYTTPLAYVDSSFINTVLDTLEKGSQISQFLNCFRNDTTGWAIDSLSSEEWSLVAKDYVTIKNKNVEDVLEAHPEVLWFTTIFDKEHEGIIDKSYKDGTNKEYMHKAISSLLNKGVDGFLSQQHSWKVPRRLEDMYLTPDFPRKVFCNDKSFIEELIVGKDGKNSEEKKVAMLVALNYLVGCGRPHLSQFDSHYETRQQCFEKCGEERAIHYENMTNFYLNILDLNTKQEDGKVAYIGRELVLKKLDDQFIETYPKVVAQLAIKEYISFQEAKQVEKFADSVIMKVLQNIDPKLLENVAGEVGETENVSVKEMRAGIEVLGFMEKMIPEKENNIEA